MNTIDSLQRMLDGLFPGLLGLRLTHADKERVSGKLTVREDLCTVGNSIHGGAMMSLADTLGAVGAYLNLPPGKRTTTIESSTKFIAGARLGSTVSAESSLVHGGKTTMVWQTKVLTQEGKLCALVTQTQLVLNAALGQ
jgi:1,4-dihydroxy-2-naphthoyl-CoA hydrolase